MVNDTPEIRVHAHGSGRRDRPLTLRITPTDNLADLEPLLYEAGINFKYTREYYGGGPERIGSYWVVIEIVVTNAAAWTAIAGVLKAYINRNKNKRITFDHNGQITEIDGYSAQEIKDLLIASREEEHARLAALYAKIHRSERSSSPHQTADDRQSGKGNPVLSAGAPPVENSQATGQQAPSSLDGEETV